MRRVEGNAHRKLAIGERLKAVLHFLLSERIDGRFQEVGVGLEQHTRLDCVGLS